MFVCPICHNSDQKYIAFHNGIPYCRKCILLNRAKKAIDVQYQHSQKQVADLNYELTKTQNKASDEILQYVKKSQSVIVNAVCGAGKTELVYKSIEYFVNQNKKVAFAIPRKDVVIEIYNRLRKDYPKLDIIAVYGGHNEKLEGQLIVLTTHQLFRYKKYFDLLILDEADAFPYYNDSLLENFLIESCKGIVIYLSATIKDSFLKKTKNVVYVSRRFHNKDLPVPIFKRYFFFNKTSKLKETINLLKNKQILIFVPTVKVGIKLSNKLHIPFVYSSFKEKQEYIDNFKKRKYQYLITTSILERGVTFFDVQVIVFEANHKLFDKSSLIQISGRVGRKLKAPTGMIYFLATSRSSAIRQCIKDIKKKNNSK